MEKRRNGAFHGGRARRRHGRRWRGARRRYLGSTVGTSASTTCRRARRSYGRTIAGRGGEGAVNLAGGCGGAARGRVGELGAGGEERQHERVQASAVASAEVGGHVGAGAGRLRRAAASTAHGRHAAGVLYRGRRVCERRAGERRGAGPRRDARQAGTRARPASAVGQKRGGGPRMRKALFYLYFQEFF